MRKLMLFVCSICICILSSFSYVFANDDIYYGKFFGDEYYIIPQIPDISLFSNLDGYSVSYYVYNYAEDSGWIQYYDTVDVHNYAALTFYEEIKLPKVIEAGTNFDFTYSIMSSTSGDTISDFYRIAFIDNDDHFLLTLSEIDSNVIVSYNSYCDEANLQVKNITLSEDCYSIRVFHRVRSAEDLESGAYVRNIGVSAFNETNLLTDIFKGIASLPGNIANSISKFFELEDDQPVEDSNSANTQLQDSLNEYNNIESSMTDNFTNSLSSLNTSVDMFNVSDFNTTSMWVSTQMTNLFNLNENIRNMIMYSLIVGFAFVLVGIGVKR